MKIGIIGLQNSGKTTIFNALTGQELETTPYSLQKAEPNLGIVEVLDERITKLSEMYDPKKTIYATIEYIDFAGFSSEQDSSEPIPANILALAKTTDALAVIVRNFSNNLADEISKLSALEQIETLESELIMSDLIIAENRKENIELSKKRGVKEAALLIEEKAIEKVISHLENENPLRTLDLELNEKKAIRGFQFISQKPMMIILNSDEDNYGKNEEIISEIEKKYKAIEFAGNFEMELSQLPEDEAAEFMQDMGISQSARNRLTKLSYDILGNISFFTVGKDEVRAWTIEKGQNAVEAAGKIHTDLARGFIRAECFSYENLIEAGSEKVLREKGQFRLEGKNYIVKDGDIISIRFSV
ncbi:MAG: YchF family ATPase [Candidatus Cloacimonetes bacterium]|nr:YchF family ATPase [Candidatus Cloacimonadota bacterium]MCF7813854.1 YchF family ATPase [Candidatus Cloacimonadota bacterium]MCF7868292.1 YchF family ATPase [Candidatus Cloacimonadota bacterium]MCF7883734.1 YchF family ATPase [Candidatus Cloacimonadota bacterium]